MVCRALCKELQGWDAWLALTFPAGIKGADGIYEFA